MRTSKKYDETDVDNMHSSPKFANSFQNIFLDIKQFPNFQNSEQELSSFQSPISKFLYKK